MGVGTLMIIFSIPLCLCLLSILIKFLHRVWWNPIRLQSVLGSQGIKGPPYRFIHGSTAEVLNMRREALSKPMELSQAIFPRVQPHMHSWIKKYGMNFLSWYGPKAQLMITEPELIKEILSNRNGTFPKSEVEGFLKKMLGDGLVTTEGKKWAKQRKLANHVFHGDSLKLMVPEMIAGIEMMLERWRHREEGKEIEAYDEFRLLTSEVISRTAFGSSYLEGKSIFEMLMKLGLLIASNSEKIRFPGLGKFVQTQDEIESDKLEQGIRESIIEIIKRREEKVKMGELADFGSDFLGLLIKANHDIDADKKISVDDMVDECKTFYVAGHETTTTLLAWTVQLLAAHTDWQEKARKEVNEVFGDKKLTPDDNAIGRLKIMNMIINESLRLFPPVLSISRKVAREARLGKFILPANLEVIVPTLAVHHDSQLWGVDAHLFKPDRFSEGVAKATNNTTIFLPFGYGPRTCVGLNFAVTEAKLALSMILQRYAFTLSPAYIHSPVQILTIRPQHGVQIILHALQRGDQLVT